MTVNADRRVRELGQLWAEGQQRNDAAALGDVLADDFKLVGPLGFILGKEEWLDQFRSGAFTVRSVSWDEVDVRIHGSAAIAIGRQTQEAAYRGQPSDGQFRVTQVAIEVGDRWLVASAHFSAIAQPRTPGA
jgi:ketosteroid isomerase-like protein